MGALGRVVLGLVITLLVAVLVAVGLIVVYDYNKAPLPLADQCVARVQGQSVPLDPEQAHYASIIVGVATQRGLAPRASTIAIATVYQESGIHNLDHGDRDSLGLFQQRPSQGWGSPEQVRDPYHASHAFYDVLVTIDGWRTGDVNDVAQAVQRSGHPNGYARHVENARRVASSLTGETPASFSCLVRNPPPGDADGLVTFLRRTLPEGSEVRRRGDTVVVEASDNRHAWSAAHIAVANTPAHGIRSVTVGSSRWELSSTEVARWRGETDGRATRVEIQVAPPATAGPTPTPSR